MEKARITEVWDRIVEAYDKTVVYGKYGVTGDPNKTLDELFASGVTPEEARFVLGVQAAIRPHDGRLDTCRDWLTEVLPKDTVDWNSQYGLFNNIDRIHPTHMKNLATTLEMRMRESE